MSFNIARRQKGSTVPTVNAFNNWFSLNQQKPSNLTYQSTKLISSHYSSTMPVNPQSSQIQQNKQPQQRIKRTYSAFRNNQTRVSVIKDDVFDLGQQIKYMTEKTKRSRLELDMMKKQFSNEIKQRQASMKQQLQTLQKIVKQKIKMDQIRTDQIKNDAMTLTLNYSSVKQSVQQLQQRLSTLEHQCGFMTFASKLYK